MISSGTLEGSFIIIYTLLGLCYGAMVLFDKFMRGDFDEFLTGGWKRLFRRR